MSIASLRAAAAACLVLCAAPAAAQEVRPAPSGPAVNALQDRVEDMERQLQEANDRADRAEHRARLAEAEVRRLQAMVNDLAAVRDAMDEIEEESSLTDEPPRRGDRSEAPSTERAQGSLGTLPASDIEESELAGGAGPMVEPGDVYDRAYGLLLSGDYPEAERSFEDFLARYPNDAHAPDARYWHAFALLARRAYRDAALGFSDYIEQNPRGRYAPDAMVRFGVALRGAGMNDAACQAFGDFRRQYPRANQALRDIAARESAAAQCGA